MTYNQKKKLSTSCGDVTTGTYTWPIDQQYWKSAGTVTDQSVKVNDWSVTYTEPYNITDAVQSLRDRLDKIEERLSIITEPNKELLENYAALKQAYDNYKVIEALVLSAERNKDNDE